MFKVKYRGLFAIIVCCSLIFGGASLSWAMDGAVVEESANAVINWTENYVEATGQAVPPSGKEGTAQGKLLAKRGAVMDLQRNMLEFIKGVKVSSETSMENFMASDEVRTSISGYIKNIQVVEANWDGEIYTVRGRIKLEKIRQSVLPVLPRPKTPASRPASSKKYGYTGLILDCRNLPLIPAMTFRVVDTSGKEVYSFNMVDQERFLSSGLCEYHTNMSWAKGRASVATKPLTVKPLRLIKPENVDIVISKKDASKIRNSKMNFLRNCRVIVVKR